MGLEFWWMINGEKQTDKPNFIWHWNCYKQTAYFFATHAFKLWCLKINKKNPKLKCKMCLSSLTSLAFCNFWMVNQDFHRRQRLVTMISFWALSNYLCLTITMSFIPFSYVLKLLKASIKHVPLCSLKLLTSIYFCRTRNSF